MIDASSTTRAHSTLLSQLMKFGLVGGVGFVIDVGVFTLLRISVLSPDVLHEGPILAKVVSTSLAIGANWVGNRYWTFGPHRSARTTLEAVEFLVVSLLGMGIGLLCLWISHYVLGFTSVLADNISSNVIGLLLGSVFRFTLYRHWVYSPRRAHRRAKRRALASE
ncbi:GtrA family protein [Planctomonas psychrotolerans]|uniref:GtrA family protein n=1 Tax=Planctomonas psychrotolerans TaxID=2528712 RepID=UPI001D0CF58F|nr:GtrA family protein [Planctomonas psychrotolerans]